MAEPIENIKPRKGKEGLVDTLGTISYSLITGSLLDYASGLNLQGIISSRVYGTAMNFPTAAPYGKWRNFWHRKTNYLKENTRIKKALETILFVGSSSLAHLTGNSSEGFFRVANELVSTNKIQDSIVDLLAFNTFQTPLYASAIAIGSFFSDGSVDLEKVRKGTEYLLSISPLLAPTLGLYLDGLRKIFNLKSAPEKGKEIKI
jgi:hypothetical protein